MLGRGPVRGREAFASGRGGVLSLHSGWAFLWEGCGTDARNKTPRHRGGRDAERVLCAEGVGGSRDCFAEVAQRHSAGQLRGGTGDNPTAARFDFGSLSAAPEHSGSALRADYLVLG
jgi:hypothetical protein